MRFSFYKTFGGWREIVGGLLIIVGVYCTYAIMDTPAAKVRAVAVVRAFVLLAAGAWLISAQMTVDLSRKVASLNPLDGCLEAVVMKRLGPPQLIENVSASESFRTWESPGYLVTLVFRDGVCRGVTREVMRS